LPTGPQPIANLANLEQAVGGVPNFRIADDGRQGKELLPLENFPSHLAELQRWKSVIINIWCTSGNEIEVMHNLGSWRVDGDGLT
jgi:hypothetical protein